DRYTAVWVEPSGDDDARMYVGVTAADLESVQARLKLERRIPRTMSAFRGSEGRTRYSGVWGRYPAVEPTWLSYRDQSEGSFQDNRATESDKNLVDVAVSRAEPPPTVRRIVRSGLEAAETRLKRKPDDRNARIARATALIQLGEDRRALDDLK